MKKALILFLISLGLIGCVFQAVHKKEIEKRDQAWIDGFCDVIIENQIKCAKMTGIPFFQIPKVCDDLIKKKLIKK